MLAGEEEVKLVESEEEEEEAREAKKPMEAGENEGIDTAFGPASREGRR